MSELHFGGYAHGQHGQLHLTQTTTTHPRHTGGIYIPDIGGCPPLEFHSDLADERHAVHHTPQILGDHEVRPPADVIATGPVVLPDHSMTIGDQFTAAITEQLAIASTKEHAVPCRGGFLCRILGESSLSA